MENYKRNIDILGKTVCFKTNSKKVLDRVIECYPLSTSENIDANIIFERGKDQFVNKDLQNKTIHVSYPDVLEVIDTYGNVNITKWVMRLVAYLFEKEDKAICLHASAVSYNNEASVFLSRTVGGKSSIAMTLLKNGFKFIHDEYVYLFWNGEKALAQGVHGVRPFVRPGFVFNNPEIEELQYLKTYFKDLEGKDLWREDQPVSFNVKSLFGSDKMASNIPVKNIFVNNFQPEKKSSIQKVNPLSDYERACITLESIRCLHKLVEDEELDIGKVSYAQENIKNNFDIDLEKRNINLKNLMENANVYSVVLGHDIKGCIKQIAQILKADNKH